MNNRLYEEIGVLIDEATSLEELEALAPRINEVGDEELQSMLVVELTLRRLDFTEEPLPVRAG